MGPLGEESLSIWVFSLYTLDSIIESSDFSKIRNIQVKNSIQGHIYLIFFYYYPFKSLFNK